MPGRSVDVPRGLEGQVPIHEQRVLDGLAEHAEQLDRLLGRHADEVEHRVVHVREEDVACLVLGGRHPLDGVPVEDLANQLRLRDLEQERVFQPGIDLVGVAEPHLLLAQAGPQGEGLVDELARQDGVRLLDRVGGRQVVVLARVDDDAGPGDEPPRHVLIDERPAHVDVAKEDPVHRVVEQHVEPLDGRHPRDLGHAQARRVVRLLDVTPALLARLVDGAADDPEVFLRGERAAVAFRRGAVRDVVEQRLGGGADHGDDVGAGGGGGLGLNGVVVDVAGGDDHVLLGRRAWTDATLESVAVLAGLVDPREGRVRVRAQGLARGVGASSALATIELGCKCEALGGILHRLHPGEHRSTEIERDPAPEQTRFTVPLDRRVHERDALVVDPLGSVRAQDGALDSDRGVGVDVALHVVRDPRGDLPAASDLADVHRYGGHGDHPLCHNVRGVARGTSLDQCVSATAA